MNKLLTALLASAFSLVAVIPAANAATVNGNFNVTVTLTSACTIGTIGDLAFGAYTAFQATAKAATQTSATLSCTRGLSGVSASFDTTAGIGSTGNAAATNATGAGVIAGLQYTVTAVPGTPVVGTAATATTLGTASTVVYAINGSIPANQAGDTAAAQTQVRTLTVNY